MTYTVIIRDPDSREIGLGIATCSIAFAGQAPFHTPRGDLVVSQAFACGADGWDMANRMAAGAAPDEAFESLRSRDPGLSYRQILAVPVSGPLFAHSGEDARPWRGHEIGHATGQTGGVDFIAAGNVLAGPEVVAAMSASVQANAAQPMAERLLSALEAARDAGGQAAAGMRLTERSAGLKITSFGDRPGFTRLDLRVDLHPSALHEMRRLLASYQVYADYADLRDQTPDTAPSMAAYEAEHWRAADGKALDRPGLGR